MDGLQGSDDDAATWRKKSRKAAARGRVEAANKRQRRSPAVGATRGAPSDDDDGEWNGSDDNADDEGDDEGASEEEDEMEEANFVSESDSEQSLGDWSFASSKVDVDVDCNKKNKGNSTALVRTKKLVTTSRCSNKTAVAGDGCSSKGSGSNEG